MNTPKKSSKARPKVKDLKPAKSAKGGTGMKKIGGPVFLNPQPLPP